MWKHKKFKNKVFTGSYEVFTTLKTKVKERVFMLTSKPTGKDNKFMKISFESWQAAKAAGWVKE